MKRILLAGTILAAVSAPAAARLQLSITDGTSTFSCFDGQLGCDLSGRGEQPPHRRHLDGRQFRPDHAGAVDVRVAQRAAAVERATSPRPTARRITFVAGDTSFTPPASSIEESASLTFNANVGAGASFLKFWADGANAQGANPLNTPGTLLDTVSGTPTTDPDSFSGTHNSLFSALGPFSMTEGGSLNLIAGGSVTGFNESMTSSFSAVPELSTWALIRLQAWRLKGARFAICARAL